MEQTDKQRETVVAKHPKLRGRTESKTSRKVSRRGGAATASPIPLPSPTAVTSPLMSPAPTSPLISTLRIPNGPRSAVVKTSLQTIVAPRTRHTHHHHHRGGRSRGHGFNGSHQSARSAPTVAESGARFAGGDPPVQDRDQSPLTLQSSKTQVLTADAPAQTLTSIDTRASQNSLRAVNAQPLSSKGSETVFVLQGSSQECVESMATSDGQLLCGWDQSLGVMLLQPPNIWNKDQSVISQQSVVPYVSSMLPNFSVWPCYFAPSEAACSTYASPALYGGVDGGLKCRPPSAGKCHPPSSARGVPRRLCSRPRPRACSPSFCGPSRRQVSPSRRTCSPHRRFFSPPRHPCSPISCYRRRCTSPAESCTSRSRTRIPYQPLSCRPRSPCRPITPPPCRQIVLSCRMRPRSRSPPCRGRSPTSPRRGRSPCYGYSPERGSARRQRLGPEPSYHRSRHPCGSQSPMRPPLSSPLPSPPPCSAEHRATQTRCHEVYDTHSDSCCSERRGLSGPAGGGPLCRARSHRSLHCAAGDYSVRGRCAENYLRSYNSFCPATDQAAWIRFIMRFLQSDELNKAVRCWMQESLNTRCNRPCRQRYFCRRHSSSSVASCDNEAPCHPCRTCSPPFRPRSRSACRPISPSCHPSRPRSRSVCHSRTCCRSHTPPHRSLTPPCRSLTPPCRPRTPPCRPRTPPCRPRTPPCRPRTPPCRPRTPPCRPRTPPCRPRTPPCRPRTPPCRPRTPPYRPRTPPCRPRTPPCRPHTPPCGSRTAPCRPRTPPCNPHTPPPPCHPHTPPCHSCTPCHQMTSPCQSRSTSRPRTPPCASCPSCRPHTPPSDPPCSKECKPCRTCDMCPPQPKTCATCKLPCTSQGTTHTSLLCSRPSSRTCWGPCISARECCSTSNQACPREAPSSCPSGSSTVMGGACFGRVPSPPMAPPPPPCMPPPPPCVPSPPGCAPRPPQLACGPPPPNMATQQSPCHIRPTPMCNFRPNCGQQIPLRSQQSPCPGPPPQCNQPPCGPPQCRPPQCFQPPCTFTPCNAAQVGLQQLSGSTAGAVVPFRNAFNELALPTQVSTNQRSGGGPVWQSPTTLFQMTVPGPPGGPPVSCTPQPPAISYCPMRMMYDASAASAAPCKPSGLPCLNAPPSSFNSYPSAKMCCGGGGNGPSGQQGGGPQGTQPNQSCCCHANMLSGPALRLLDELGPMQGPFGRAPFAPPPIPHCSRLKGPCLPHNGTSQQMNNSSVFNAGSINDVTKLGVQPCQGRGMCCSCSGGGGVCGGCRQAPMSCYPGRTGPGSDADCACTAGKGPPIDFFRPLEPMVRSRCSSRSSVDAGSSPICSQNCNKMCCVNAPRGTGNLRASLAARESTLGGEPQLSRRSCLPKRPTTMCAAKAGGQEN